MMKKENTGKLVGSLVLGSLLLTSVPFGAAVAESPLAIGAGESGGDGASLQDNPQEAFEDVKQQILLEGPGFAINGELKVEGQGGYSISGEKFVISDATRKPKSLRNGDFVQVRGKISKDGKKIARVITTRDAATSPSYTSADDGSSAVDGEAANLLAVPSGGSASR